MRKKKFKTYIRVSGDIEKPGITKNHLINLLEVRRGKYMNVKKQVNNNLNKAYYVGMIDGIDLALGLIKDLKEE